MQLDIQQILQGLRKRWWLALIVALTAAAVAYLYSNSQPQVYQSQVTVSAKPVPPDNGLIEAIKKTLPTYAREMANTQLITQVVDDYHIPDVDPANVALKTQARPDDNSIVMTVDHASNLVAAQLAEGVSNAFIEKQAAENQQANASGQRVVWVVTQAATVPSEPYQPRPKLYAAAAGAFGLLLGLLLAIGLELLDTSLRTPAEVKRYTGINTIGVIPKGKS
ncbi:MAG: Wzz/FepE/Etk N-terminal domain-containing protein [Chloroflexota bacterium]